MICGWSPFQARARDSRRAPFFPDSPVRFRSDIFTGKRRRKARAVSAAPVSLHYFLNSLFMPGRNADYIRVPCLQSAGPRALQWQARRAVRFPSIPASTLADQIDHESRKRHEHRLVVFLLAHDHQVVFAYLHASAASRHRLSAVRCTAESAQRPRPAA